ncbi:hypothetical protein TrVFT333_007102 [Trichoderma virens FT-333]|nr:hypothetical protein TrVFT333_007102 [Trichoderma virens FT-333]
MAAETDFGEFQVLLLDIEGTVCPISFVKDVLFPYALDVLPKFLIEQWDESSFAEYRNAFPEEYRNDRSAFEAHVRDLVARDVKASYLKALQGYLWKKGYESGVLKAPLFPDVPPFITNAHAAGQKIMIYSVLISDWFDTVNAGPKTDVASYTTILSHYPDISPARWIFLSDNLNEVDAARQSGMHSVPAVRPGNAPLPSHHPLTEFALSEFTPASVSQAVAAIASKKSA